MAYREKIAWLTMVTLILAYGAYFLVVGPRVGFGESELLDIVWTFGPVAVVHALAMIIGSIALAASAPKEANAAADERERAIASRRHSIGYPVLIAGLILVGIMMPFNEPPFKVINTAILVIVIAEVLGYGAIIWGYRRS